VTAPDAWFFFDASERALVSKTLDHVRDAAPEHHSLLCGNLTRLASLAALIRDSAAIGTSWQSMRGTPGEALIDLLRRVPDYDVELHIPTRAVLGQAYLVAKINFFKSLTYALDGVASHDALRAEMEAELGQSIYSKMLEELFLSVVTDRTATHALKGRAAALLFRIWDDRLLAEVDDVAPLLESAWEARNKVRPVLGTMLGAHEIFRLFREARDDRFLEYYTSRDEVTADEMAAFEEFLFGLSHEDIGALRRHLSEQHLAALTPAEARDFLGPHHDAWASTHTGPQALYSDYRRRRMLAASRALNGLPGPKKVAEEYVLAAWLCREG
jgi:hypothetical protein